MTKTTTMPTINLDTAKDVLTADEFGLLTECVKADGTLRASKPKTATGEAQYLWRQIAFGISPKAQHQCMPVMAFCDLPQDDHDERRAVEQRLDDLSNRIEKLVPVNERHGTLRWARLLG